MFFKKKEKEIINFLDLVPVQKVEAEIDQNKIVTLLIPRFKNLWYLEKFSKFLSNKYFKLKLDEFGTETWNCINGFNDIRTIGEILTKKFGEKIQPVYDRLHKFFSTLIHYTVIEYKEINKEKNMGTVLGLLKPELIWHHFEEICKYPRPSKKEEKIAAYIKEVGVKNNLETLVDAFGNIVIKKPATKGFENRKTIVLQGHIDMVCEKNNDVAHDFDNDPIQPYIDGEWVRAKGTTLGADNGIGVAAALAVLEDNTLQHGPLEFLFTLDEETGLTGASSLDKNILKADILLNLDSEEEGTVFIGCSGGKTTHIKIKFEKESLPKDYLTFELKISGLLGGHSGLEIHQGLGNSVKLLNRVIWDAINKYDLKLTKIEGGNKHNAIPREALAIVSVPKAKKDEFIKFVNEYNLILKSENSTKEKNLNLSVTEATPANYVIDGKTQFKLVNALYAVPHGVIKMSADIPDLVETSTNLATILTEDDCIKIVTSQRSSVATENQDIVNMVSSVFKLIDAEITYGDGYPGWKPNVNSEILGVVKNTYKDLYGKEPEIKAIHAGLECGIINEKYPNMDMISFGPTMFGVHSPDERLKIDTVPNFWNLLINILKNVPKK